MMLIPNNKTQMHLQQNTKKFLSLHFTHDISGPETFKTGKKFKLSECRNGGNIIADSKKSVNKERGNT